MIYVNDSYSKKDLDKLIIKINRKLNSTFISSYGHKWKVDKIFKINNFRFGVLDLNGKININCVICKLNTIIYPDDLSNMMLSNHNIVKILESRLKFITCDEQIIKNIII